MTASNTLIADHSHGYVKGGLKVTDCIVLSAEYWCPNNIKVKHEIKNDFIVDRR